MMMPTNQTCATSNAAGDGFLSRRRLWLGVKYSTQKITSRSGRTQSSRITFSAKAQKDNFYGWPAKE